MTRPPDHRLNFFFFMIPRPPASTLFPYTTLFRSFSSPSLSSAAFLSDSSCWKWVSASFLSRLRSEEHTSELQSRRDLVCRLLLEKKNERHRDRAHRVKSGIPRGVW